MKHKAWFYGGAAGAVMVAALAWAFAPRPVEVELAAATQGRFEITVDEDGKTRLAERYVVAAPLAGRLARIALREGDAVMAGATVASLTPVLPVLLDERTLRELQARVEGAQAAVQRGSTRIARASVALEQARNDSRRGEQLAQQGFIAATKLETDRLAVRAAEQEVQSAAADRHMAEHDLEQARAALGTVRTPVGTGAKPGFAVTSPVAGQVLRVLQSSEASVALGTPLMELGDTRQLEVVAELLTTDALAAQPGSEVFIERWGGSGALRGRVKLVEPAAFTKVSALGVEEQRVRVLIAITSPQAQWQALGDGFRVSVRIVTQAQPQALQVPVSAVFPLPADAVASVGVSAGASAVASSGGGGDDSGKQDAATESPRYAVFVAEAGRARLQPVWLAGRNGSMAWLKPADKSGVAVGTQVIVYPPAALRDGARIKMRKV
jgi:HlyD family secretion protein